MERCFQSASKLGQLQEAGAPNSQRMDKQAIPCIRIQKIKQSSTHLNQTPRNLNCRSFLPFFSSNTTHNTYKSGSLLLFFHGFSTSVLSAIANQTAYLPGSGSNSAACFPPICRTTPAKGQGGSVDTCAWISYNILQNRILPYDYRILLLIQSYSAHPILFCTAIFLVSNPRI